MALDMMIKMAKMTTKFTSFYIFSCFFVGKGGGGWEREKGFLTSREKE